MRPPRQSRAASPTGGSPSRPHAARWPDARRALAHAYRLVALLAVLGVSALARAETLQAPVGGKPIPLGHERIACAEPGGGWASAGAGLSVRPPNGDDAIGKAVPLRVAADRAACATGSTELTLVAVGPPPALDPTPVVVNIDAGEVEMHGRGLRGVGLAWQARGASGADVCREPKPAGASKRCTWSIAHDLPADPSAIELAWVPPGGRHGPDVTTFDAEGHVLEPSSFAVTPTAIVVSRLIPDDAAVDLATGVGEIPLVHPDAVTGIECSGASCELAKTKLVVRAQTSLVDSVDVRFALAPGVAFSRDERLDLHPTLRLSVLHCPMSVVSGRPLRGLDSAALIVRLQGRCAEDLGNLHFLEGSRRLDVVKTETDTTEAWAVLRLGRITASELTITAARGGAAEIPVAVTRTPTRSAPDVRSVLEIPGLPRLSFIPSNRGAVVHVSPPGDHARLVVLPVAGVYTTEQRGKSTLVEGDPYAAGATNLSFGYRSNAVPAPLRDVDLGVLEDPLARPVEEVNVPAPLGGTLAHPAPLAEVVCGERRSFEVLPGVTAYLPYELRDACRLVVHRERLAPEYGTQKLSLEVDVLRADGSERSEAHASQTLILRPGHEPLEAWIHGVAAPFDRIVVRLSHAADETHYAVAAEMLTTEPALKWTAVLGSGRARLYATPTIPTGLYRFGDAEHSGVLSLNFGVISRLTWLDKDGQEGLLNLEGGVMVIGLAGSQSTTGRSLSQAGVVAGLGLGVPIANRWSITEAAINLHLWFERDLATPDSAVAGRPWSIIFGPSISIGNVGANL